MSRLALIRRAHKRLQKKVEAVQALETAECQEAVGLDLKRIPTWLRRFAERRAAA